MLVGRSVVLAVTGGVAAYKACELCRLLGAAGAEVQVAMTAGARRFVRPLSFAALSGRRVLTRLMALHESADGRVEIDHVEAAHRAEVVVVAPATASFLARMASGAVTDIVDAVVLSTRAPVVLAPAMETGMWENPATQRNLALLACDPRVRIAGPATGALASGRSGLGRMLEPAELMAWVAAALAPQDLRGRTLLVTAGPTREPLDPVRYLSNRSSGRMGFALAAAAAARGAAVRLVHGPSSLAPPTGPGLRAIAVETAAEMHAAVTAEVAGADVAIMAAAVADWTPAERMPQKLKKSAGAPSLALARTVDILAELGGRTTRPLLVGFAAETEDLEAHARAKLTEKRLDLIVANDVSQAGIGFDATDNAVLVLSAKGGRWSIGPASKHAVAHAVLDHVAELLRS